MAWNSLDLSADFCELHVHAIYSGLDQIHVLTMDVAEDPGLFWELLRVDKIGHGFSPKSLLSKATKEFESREKGPSLDFSALRVLMVGEAANWTATLDKADKLGEEARRSGTLHWSSLWLVGDLRTASTACSHPSPS